MSASVHVPVMVREVVESLAPRDDGIYVDGTFGGGGTSRALLDAARCRVVAIDRDPAAIARASVLVKRSSGRFMAIVGCFGDMVSLLRPRLAPARHVDGVTLDLGLSSDQLADPSRGFSFAVDGPLDMRMGHDGPSAADIVNDAAEADLADLLFRYGEERNARRIARAIVAARAQQKITRSLTLANIVRGAQRRPAAGEIDAATRTFQALRIAANDELGELARGLAGAEVMLGPGGRLAVVAFHSLEDRMVKTFLRDASQPPAISRHRPSQTTDAPTFSLVNRRALRPNATEIAANPRARSARLRTAARTDAAARHTSGHERGIASMKRFGALLWLSLAIATGATMFEVSYRVRTMESELATLNKRVLADQEAIHVLRGEWAYLTQPARLSRLAQQHLAMEAATGDSLIEFTRLPFRKDAEPAEPLVAKAPNRAAQITGGEPAVAKGQKAVSLAAALPRDGVGQAAWRLHRRLIVRLTGDRPQALEVARTRLVALALMAMLALLVVSLRLVHLTLIREGSEPVVSATDRSAVLRLSRADIVDRNGALLATSLVTASLYADAKLVADKPEVARKLARIFPDIGVEAIAEKLRGEKRFVWIKRNITPSQQYAVNRLGIPGLDFQREERRAYPQGALTAHVIGYTGIDNRGLSGLEQSRDTVIRGANAPVRLSIDLRVQEILHDEIAGAIVRFRAAGGTGLVLDADSGELLALVSMPDFDPNRVAKQPSDESRFNRATMGVYEMGSTFKVFNTAMALDSGRVSLADQFDATSPIRVGRFTIEDYHPQARPLTVAEIFKYSSNIGSAKLALAMGGDAQRAFLTQLGLLRPARIELPEVGVPQAPNPWRDVSTMTVAYGYGISVTPLQLANGVAASINGGTLRDATLFARANGAGGERVMGEATSNAMRRLLRLVVMEGTGTKAAVKGYIVGGKTGTAEKSGNSSGYAQKSLVSSFVGAFPMDRPRYVVLVMVDEPHGDKQSFGYATGGWVAAPVAARVIARMAPLLGIQPRHEDEAVFDGAIAAAFASGGRLHAAR